MGIIQGKYDDETPCTYGFDIGSINIEEKYNAIGELYSYGYVSISYTSPTTETKTIKREVSLESIFEKPQLLINEIYIGLCEVSKDTKTPIDIESFDLGIFIKCNQDRLAKLILDHDVYYR